ncbi:MAG: copper resistance system multicopper oxidase [Sphingobium sp.]|nr:copper resistance system multicopper oxidase [Sphingobium sp.]
MSSFPSASDGGGLLSGHALLHSNGPEGPAFLHGNSPKGPALSRRHFVQGFALCTGVCTGLSAGLAPRGASAASPLPSTGNTPPILTGKDFNLSIGTSAVNFTGRTRQAITVNNSLPAPILRWKEGDTVTLKVSSHLPEHVQTSLHWHGIVLPANMDGVPGMSFNGIYPGESYLYRFHVRQAGTYWYHSHSLHQEQAGLYGAIIIDPQEPAPYSYDREHVILFSDWTDLDPAALFRRLKKMPAYDNMYKRTLGDFIRDARDYGLSAAIEDRKMWAGMRMTPTDLSDVNGLTYTYLMNGHTPGASWQGEFRHGEKVLLRLINASNMTYFDFRIPGLKMTVVAADGQYVHPVTVDELRICVAETYDVIVEPAGQNAFTLFAQDMGRTGYAAGTLCTRAGLKAEIPALDPRPLLSMKDMGMDHSGHGKHDPYAGFKAERHDAPTLSGPVSHARTEKGSTYVDMQAMVAQPRLDDPGVGLRDREHKVLTYADLHSLGGDPDGRDPGRTIELHLTGNMERFGWAFDGVPFMDSKPLKFNYGERLRVVLVNDTMMHHPVHLHGMWSDLENEDGAFQVRKHTVDIAPGSRRSYRVTADALGRWAYHCHLLYHMDGGMMREVRVEEA